MQNDLQAMLHSLEQVLLDMTAGNLSSVKLIHASINETLLLIIDAPASAKYTNVSYNLLNAQSVLRVPHTTLQCMPIYAVYFSAVARPPIL